MRWLFAALAVAGCGGAPPPEAAAPAEVDDLDLGERGLGAPATGAPGPGAPAASPGTPRSEPPRSLPSPPRAPIYRGRKIDLDLRNADLHNVFRFLATVGGVSVVVAPDVRGQVTLLLRQVPWDQALDVIARAHQLEVERDGSVLLIRKR